MFVLKSLRILQTGRLLSACLQGGGKVVHFKSVHGAPRHDHDACRVTGQTCQILATVDPC